MNTENDCKNLLQKVDAQRLVSAETISILGGSCPAEQILDFVGRWPALSGIPNRIWEYTDAIRFEEGSKPDDHTYLERGRLFGTSGDLTLRRDGNQFHWWFIGPGGVTPPEIGTIQSPGFWEKHKDTKFYKNTETALLWGEYSGKGDDHFWFEDRVAGADLHYPIEGLPHRVELAYETYSHAGRVEFVWLKELREWKE